MIRVTAADMFHFESSWMTMGMVVRTTSYSGYMHEVQLGLLCISCVDSYEFLFFLDFSEIRDYLLPGLLVLWFPLYFLFFRQQCLSVCWVCLGWLVTCQRVIWRN